MRKSHPSAPAEPPATIPGHQFDPYIPAWDGQVLGDWNHEFQTVIEENCQSELAFYFNPVGAISRSDHVTRLVHCILLNTPEFRKAEISAGAIVMGLVPSLLLLFAPSSMELGLLSLRRPVLSFLLGAGSTEVFMPRGLDFGDPVAALADGDVGTMAGAWTARAMSRRDGGGRKRWAESLVVYGLALAAVANVVHLAAWQIGERALTSTAWDITFLPILWALTTVVINLFGYIILRLSTQDKDATHPSASFLSCELTPSRLQPPVRLRPRPSLLAPILWLLACIGIVAHVLFGTLVMSSLLFFHVTDAAAIAARFLASTVVCRVVLEYELVGMRMAAREPRLVGRAARGKELGASGEERVV